MNFQPSTEEISRSIVVQEDRELLTLLLVFAGLSVLIGTWGYLWYHAAMANQYLVEPLGWRLAFAALMAMPLMFGGWHLEWRTK